MAAPNSFDLLVADMNAGLDMLADSRRHAPDSFEKAWGHAPVELARDAAETRRSIAASRRRTAATRRLGAEVRAMTATVAASSVATAAVLAAAKHARLRDGLKQTMAKAMSLFSEGRITGDQVRIIEARTNRLGEALGL